MASGTFVLLYATAVSTDATSAYASTFQPARARSGADGIFLRRF